MKPLSRFSTLLFSTGLVSVLWADGFRDLASIASENEQTVIFRRKPTIFTGIIIPLTLIVLGLWFFYFRKINYHGESNTIIRKIKRSVCGPLAVGFGAYLLYCTQYDYRHREQPLIILDNHGIWYEPHKKRILWTDVEDISYIKVQQYRRARDGREEDLGFHWKTVIESEFHQKLVIDERSTNLSTGTLLVGGALGQCIGRHYNAQIYALTGELPQLEELTDHDALKKLS